MKNLNRNVAILLLLGMYLNPDLAASSATSPNKNLFITQAMALPAVEPRSFSKEAIRFLRAARIGFIKGDQVTAEDEKLFHLKAYTDSTKVLDADPTIIQEVQSLCANFLKEHPDFREVLIRMGYSVRDARKAMRILNKPEDHFSWGKVFVTGPETYIMGSGFVLVPRVIRLLRAKENSGSDKNLAMEYILHEVLENFERLSHEEIIAFTNHYFGRPDYNRPGETPVGKILRQLLNDGTIAYSNLQYLKENVQKERDIYLASNPPLSQRPLYFQIRLNEAGQIATLPFAYQVILSWDEKGHIEISHPEQHQIENGVTKYISYNGTLPKPFTWAVARYNEWADETAAESRRNEESLQPLRDLMLAHAYDEEDRRQRWTEWTGMLAQKPLGLALLLESLAQQSIDDLSKAVEFIIDGYHGQHRKALDDVLRYLALVDLNHLKSIRRNVDLGLYPLYRSPKPLRNRLLDNANRFDETLDALLPLLKESA